MIPKIPILLSDNLKDLLTFHGVDPEDYKPAYDGRSIGLDLYNCGEDIVIPPGVRDYTSDWALGGKATEDIKTEQFKQLYKNLIPTGLKMALPSNWTAIIKERGSIIKTTLKVRAGVIDPDYTGEVFVNCVNLSLHPVTIKSGQKLPFQLIVVQANTNFKLVTPEQYEELTSLSTRKEGKVGSSDK